jgi:hypothetical protein
MTVETRWPRRRHLIVFALAAVSFLVIAGLLLLSAAFRGDGVPQPAAHEDRYAAIMVRGAWPASPDGLDVVAVLADGRERTVAHLDRTKMPNEVGAMVSASGWLALADDKPAGSRSWMLIDLLGRAAPVPLDDPRGLGGGGWSPDGRFATTTNAGQVLVMRPQTGEVRRIAMTDGDLPRPWFVDWTADGSGIVRSNFSWVGFGLPRQSQVGPGAKPGLDALAMDGGRASTAAGLQSSLGARVFDAAGAVLQLCDGSRGFTCPLGAAVGSVVVETAAGIDSIWYREPPGDRTMDVSLAADSRGLWVLAERFIGGGRHVIVKHADAALGSVVDVGRVPLPPSVAGATFSGLAPDDSMLAILAFDGQAVRTVIAVPSLGTATYRAGVLAGFVPIEVASAWPGEAFASVTPAQQPTAGPAPTLPAIADLEATHGAREPTLLSASGGPLGAAPGPTVVTRLGPIKIVEGMGVAFACVGPGEASYTANGETVTDRCMGGTNDQAGPGIPAGEAFVTVQSDPRTAWTIVIYDPTPPRRR